MGGKITQSSPYWNTCTKKPFNYVQQMPSKFEHLDPLTSFNVYLLSSDVGHMLAK